MKRDPLPLRLTEAEEAPIFAGMADALQHLPRKNLCIGGEIGRRIELTIQQNVLNLDVEGDFLRPFVERASNAPGDYVGLGKLLDALARFAAWPGQDEVRALKERVINRLRETQEADGYIGVFRPEERGWKLWDMHEMAYIVVGLVSDFNLHGDQKSLESAERLMRYMMKQAGPELEEAFRRQQITFQNATIGLETAFMSLSEATGRREYIDFWLPHTGLKDWDWPILMDYKGHAYTYLARCLEQLELYRVTGDTALLGQTRKILQFLLAENGLVITGGLSQMERWTDNQFGQHALAETCAVAYLLKVLDSYMRLAPDPLFGDVMERIIFNTLFAAQSPDGRKIRYFTPFEGERHYFDRDTYCCPGNFRRVMADLASMAYYQDADGLYINLYTASEATLDLEDVSVRVEQVTDYPSDGHVEVRVEPSKPIEFSLKLRIPRWSRDAQITVAGEAHNILPEPGNTLAIRRIWNPGDRVQVTFPTPFRAVRGREMQSRHVAFMRGPLVFGVNTSRQVIYMEADLPLVRVDPERVDGPHPDRSVRPEGLQFTGYGWSKASGFNGSADLRLEFSEFADPGIRRIYFMTPDLLDEAIVDDELYQPDLRLVDSPKTLPRG